MLLITGGCGCLGNNLAEHAWEMGYERAIVEHLSRVGSVDNLKWLKPLGKKCMTMTLEIMSL